MVDFENASDSATPELHSTEGWEMPLENNAPFLFCSYTP